MLTVDESKNDVDYKLLSDKIKIKDVVKALQIADIRTALRWCKKKSILVLKFGKEKYINLIDFELAVDRPFIESLRTKNPENWKEIYSAYKKGDVLTIMELTFSADSFLKTKFVAPGTSGNNFLKKISTKTK